MRYFFLAIATIAGLSGTAQASVLEFETGAISGAGIYTESDYSLSVTPFTGGNAALGTSSKVGNETQILAFCSSDSDCAPGTFLTLTSGAGVFSILSIDSTIYGSEGATQGTEGQIDLVGSLLGGGTMTQSLMIGTSWISYSTPGFDNLTSLEIIGLNAFAFEIDNLELVVGDVSAVPDSPTWATLLFGLFGVGTAMRRRKARAKVSFA